MFTKPFQKYVCEGDSITCTIGDLELTARIYRDDCSDTPEERQDGFWPSLDPKDAGYIGPKSKRTLERQTAKAKAILESWKKDEWFYCGIAVTVSKNEVELLHAYDVALWGVEANFPGSDNRYLLDTANELLNEALERAREVLAKLCA